MKSFFAALSFLTRLPVPHCWCGGERELGRSLAFFPIVGLLIGAFVAALGELLGLVFPPLVASAILVIALLAVSGGLHLDGLADTADAFFSSRSRERMLEIMRDSRSGPMGVMAVVCVLLIKFSALASAPAAQRWAVLLLMPLAGRAALVVSLQLLPYARAQGGLASIFHAQRSRGLAAWAVTLLAGAGWCALGRAGLVAACATVVVIFLFAACTRRKIGGLTGDTLGAV